MKNCHSKKAKSAVQGTSFLSLLLIVIIPKCGFCVFAYSSAIAMCGVGDINSGTNNWVSYIPLLLAVVIITMIIINNRGIRTIFATTIAIAGFLIILSTHQSILPMSYYNVGTAVMVLAIWANGSFMAFVSLLELLKDKIKLAWPR